MAYKKGQSGNPNGRPKTGAAELEKLREAIKHVEKKAGIKLYERAVAMAYKEPSMMAAILRKLIPDMQYVEHAGEVTVLFDKRYEKV